MYSMIKLIIFSIFLILASVAGGCRGQVINTTFVCALVSPQASMGTNIIGVSEPGPTSTICTVSVGDGCGVYYVFEQLVSAWHGPPSRAVKLVGFGHRARTTAQYITISTDQRSEGKHPVPLEVIIKPNYSMAFTALYGGINNEAHPSIIVDSNNVRKVVAGGGCSPHISRKRSEPWNCNRRVNNEYSITSTPNSSWLFICLPWAREGIQDLCVKKDIEAAQANPNKQAIAVLRRNYMYNKATTFLTGIVSVRYDDDNNNSSMMLVISELGNNMVGYPGRLRAPSAYAVLIVGSSTSFKQDLHGKAGGSGVWAWSSCQVPPISGPVWEAEDSPSQVNNSLVVVGSLLKDKFKCSVFSTSQHHI